VDKQYRKVLELIAANWKLEQIIEFDQRPLVILRSPTVLSTFYVAVNHGGVDGELAPSITEFMAQYNRAKS
jgi:hypothetical protein